MALATTLAGVLAAALLFGYVALRLRLSPIVGYLVAGVCVGPFTPGFVAHAELARELADVGVVLLMFGVGLQFHPREIVAMRRIVVPAALGQVLATSALGASPEQIDHARDRLRGEISGAPASSRDHASP